MENWKAGQQSSPCGGRGSLAKQREKPTGLGKQGRPSRCKGRGVDVLRMVWEMPPYPEMKPGDGHLDKDESDAGDWPGEPGVPGKSEDG